MKSHFLFSIFLLAGFAQAQQPQLLSVTVKGKQGYIDTVGKIVIAPQYDVAFGFFGYNWANVKKEGKYYMINRAGELVTPQAFETYFDVDTWNGDTLLITKKNGKYGLMDMSLREVASFIYDKIESFKHDIAIAVKNGKRGYLDFKGNFTDMSEYNKVYNMSEGFLSIRKKEGDEEMWIYNTQTQQIELGPYNDVNMTNSFRDGKLILYVGNSKNVIINTKGEIILTPPYNCHIAQPVYTDSLYPIGLLYPEENRKYGVMDKHGNILLKPDKKYYSISFFKKVHGEYLATFEVKSEEGKKTEGIMNAKGEIIIHAVYENLRMYGEDYLVFKKNGKWGVSNWKEEVIVPAIYDDLVFYGEDIIKVTIGRDHDEKEGYLNIKTGKFIWNPTYRWRED